LRLSISMLARQSVPSRNSTCASCSSCSGTQ
jgi:hypothetical protein